MSNALFLGNLDDKSFVPHLKGLFNGMNTFVCLEPINMLAQLEMYCARRQITAIVSTNTAILQKLLEREGNSVSSPSLDNYQGSVFTLPGSGREIVFVNPLRQLFTVSYGKFIASRFISKVTARDAWKGETEFSWTLLKPDNIESIYQKFKDAYAIAVDIETFKENLAIRCISYTAIYLLPSGDVRTESVVLPITDSWALAWMRKFNVLPAAKIFQNGKYDNSYLLRYNAPVTNWLWDTAHLFHSYYSELPKDLAYIASFFVRKVVYWKDLAETNDLFEYYKYNALDTWATANVWIHQMLEYPDWAARNYALEFPLVYPCLLAEMTGIKRDNQRHIEARNEVLAQENKALASIRKMVGSDNFNPGSPQQVVKLLKVLGCQDITSSEEKDLKKAILRHPLNGRILEKILEFRGVKKLRTTYLRTNDDITKTSKKGAKELRGRILYALNPHGTDTARLASKEHHFWCGLQIQNIPRGEPGEPSYTKQTLCSEDGWFLGECDLEQAESRDTAHIAGDTKLIGAVTGERDFHSVNASAFFGVPYDSIYDDAARKTRDKKLRDLAKRVNHGANYNMGPGVLVDTMGLDKIWEAKRLLKLPFNDPLDVAKHLLDSFHKTYPQLRGKDVPFSSGTYYAWVAQEITVNKRLTSRAFHHTEYNERVYNPREYIEFGDWTRYCFGNPVKNKLDLNSYVAHCPQSLNARTLNEAFLEVFYKVALPNPTTFRLHAQIHDSILFSYKDGWEKHAEAVHDCMEIPVTLKDISGEYRKFTVPAALKLGKKDKQGVFHRAKYWSDTE